jgi:hypothetical protein
MRPSRGSKQVPGSRRYLKCRRWLPSFSRAVSAAQAAESVAVALAEPRRGLASQAWTSRVPIPLARFNLRRQGPDAANAPTFQTYVRILGACSWFESGGPFRAPEGRLHHDCTKNSTTWAPTDLVGKRNQRNDPAHPRTTKTWLVLMTSEPATLTPSLDDRKQSPPPRMAPRSPFVVVCRPTLNRSRVEVWRGGLGRCLCSLLTRSFVCGCHIISTMLRFHTPLIKPGGRISRTRLSDKACKMAIHTRSPTNRCRDVR